MGFKVMLLKSSGLEVDGSRLGQPCHAPVKMEFNYFQSFLLYLYYTISL